MNKLPKIFRNNIDNICNNKDIYYSYQNTNASREDTVDKRNIMQKINSIFNSSNYIYKANVIIKLKNEELKTQIIGKNNTHLITKDNELIPITDIIDIIKNP